MVDALRKVHRMLVPDGRMVEVHEVPGQIAIEVHSSSGISTVGRLASWSDFSDERQATAAVDSVINQRLFSPHAQRMYDFRAHFESLEALGDHLAENWQDAYLSEDTAARVIELGVAEAADTPRSIVVLLRARMRLLQKL